MDKNNDYGARIEKESFIPENTRTMRKRKHLTILYARRLLRCDSRLLTIICIISFVFFSITLAFSGHHIIQIISDWKSTETEKSNYIFTPQAQTITNNQLSIYDRNITYDDFNYLNSTSLTYVKRIYSNDTEILFRLPNKVPTKALLLIFHGCSRSAHEWFHTVERQRIVGAAIDLGYGCLAFQATDQSKRCWSSHTDIDENRDAKMIYKGLGGFYQDHSELESLPRFTFGASSGGIFSSIFAVNQRYKITGQIIFIGIVHPKILERHVRANLYPPTAWIHMTGDIEFASENRINASMLLFAKEKIPHISFPIKPICVTAITFHSRIPTIKIETSNYIFDRLQKNNWLNSENELVYNPRQKDSWRSFLFDTTKWNSFSNRYILANLEVNKKLLPDFLNTIYGEHEISFERSFEALKWHRDLYNNTN